MSDAETKIEAAAEIASEAVEQAEAEAEAVIEAAEDRIEAAEQAAEDIAQAAIMSELGRQVQDIRERVEQWQGNIQSEILALTSRLAEAEIRLTEASEQIAALQPPAVVVMETPATEQPLIPAPSPEPEAVAAVILPGQAKVAPSEDTSLAPAKRRTRLI